MAAEQRIRSLLADSRTLSALDEHYKRTMERIRRQLAAGVSQPGSARAAALTRRINELIDDLDPKKDSFVRRWIRRTAPKAFVLGDMEASRDLRNQISNIASDTAQTAGITGVDRSFNVINKSALKGITAAMEANFSRTAQDIRSTIGTTIRNTQVKLLQQKKINRAIVGGKIRGAAGREIANDIASSLLGKKVKPEVKRRLEEVGFQAADFKNFEQIARDQVIRVGKRRLSVRAYSDLVARTQLREANKVGTIVRLQKNDIDHVKVSKHAQAKPDECTPFAGKVFYIGPLAKDPLGFPKLANILNGGPPFHPNCRHSIAPYVTPFKSKKVIDKDRELANKIPRRFFGKGGADIREEVAALSDKELRDRFPEQLDLVA